MNLKRLKETDWQMLLCVTLLFAYGLPIIASATSINQGGSVRSVVIQSVAFCLGLLMISLTFLFDYQDFQKYEKHLYVLNIVLLLLVYIPGLRSTQMGAAGWITIAKGVYLQPVELVKISYILSFGAYLSRTGESLKTLSGMAKAMLYPLPIVLILLKQPDLGGVIVIACITIGMMFMAGMNLRVFFSTLVLSIISLPFLYSTLLPHQRRRLDSFLGISKEDGNAFSHVQQSMIAIGSGRVFGKGLFNGTQNQYGFLPIRESDFIFSVIGEELGFVGILALLGLYLWFFNRIFILLYQTRDDFGQLVVTGILSMFFYQFTQNVGMTMGLVPVTGLTLPFVSYGGSSMVTSLFQVGLLLNVGLRKDRTTQLIKQAKTLKNK